MFERRLKILLAILAVVISALLLRAAQLQMLDHEYWSVQAVKALQQTQLVETTRGAILDRNGRVLAVDRPCVDACVRYQAIVLKPNDPLSRESAWLKEVVTKRLEERLGDAWTHTPARQRKELRQKETDDVLQKIDQMWTKLAEVSGQTREQIDEIRQAVIDRVATRKRYVWYQNYEQALNKPGSPKDGELTPFWQRWLSGDTREGPQIDNFAVTVSEEMQPHVILHNVELEVQNELGRHPDKYPGLVMRPGTHRYYPLDDVACHLLGHMAKVNHEDIRSDPNAGNPQRKYLPNDMIGRTGLEALCEPALRGTLGKITTVGGDQKNQVVEPPVSGQDVKTTIDIDLQEELQQFFASARLRDNHHVVVERDAVLHGAAVVIDVKTNDVLALVSYPTYDLNLYDEKFDEWNRDQVNAPLRNRATESQLEPGSTVKPLVGLSAITQGVIGVNEGIECTGFLVLDNGRTKYSFGRCWVASKWSDVLGINNVAHHPVPTNAPHRGHDGNKDGWLTYSDALERSCNVYFETVADKLKIDTLSSWMERFGLGHPTGIGITEFRGRVPSQAKQIVGTRRAVGFFAGIGQGSVWATPIQMANVAATIARDGIWMRPHLILREPGVPFPANNLPTGPERVDLHLSPEALRACKLGMVNVVNSLAGTGTGVARTDMVVAAKTGTAQAAQFKTLKTDRRGKPIRDAAGNRQYETYQLSTPEHPNPKMPWYRGSGRDGKDFNHSWMIGFAPAENPQVAFAVLVEYGGSGGGPAADVANEALDACIAHRHLFPPHPPRAEQARADASTPP